MVPSSVDRAIEIAQADPLREINVGPCRVRLFPQPRVVTEVARTPRTRLIEVPTDKRMDVGERKTPVSHCSTARTRTGELSCGQALRQQRARVRNANVVVQGRSSNHPDAAGRMDLSRGNLASVANEMGYVPPRRASIWLCRFEASRHVVLGLPAHKRARGSAADVGRTHARSRRPRCRIEGVMVDVGEDRAKRTVQWLQTVARSVV